MLWPDARLNSIMLMIMILLQRTQTLVSFTEVTTEMISVLLAVNNDKWLTQLDKYHNSYFCV